MTSTLLQRKKIVPIKRRYTMRVADERRWANKVPSAGDGGRPASKRYPESLEVDSLEGGPRAHEIRPGAINKSFVFFLPS